MRKFKVQYSKFKFSEKPQEFDKRTQQYSQYVEALVTLDDFVDMVNDGRCWRNGEHSKPRFQKKNVVGSRFLALDFDESEYTPEEVINFGREKGLVPNVFYFSFSQGKKEGNNFRLVFVLDEIAKPKEWLELYNYFLKKFSSFEPDTATKDIGRMWYGGKDGYVVEENLLNLDSVWSHLELVRPSVSLTHLPSSSLSSPIDVTFPEGWQDELARVCILWRKFADGEYLNRSQRFILFTNLKAGGAAIKDYILELGSRTNVYEGHGFGPQELDKWWKEDVEIVPIVKSFGKDMTVAEYFKNRAF